MEKNSSVFPLYDPRFEHDSCGIGAVISIRGIQSHRTVDDALKIVEKLQHRAGKDACGETGDGVGLMMQIPHRLMVKAAAQAGIEDLGPARSYGVGMFFFPQDTLKRLQARKMGGVCWKSLSGGTAWSSSAGGRYPSVPMFWERLPGRPCPASCSAL